jgi:hypothetical protein
MRGAISPLLQYAFIAWCSVEKKHRDNFTVIFTLRDALSTYSDVKGN